MTQNCERTRRDFLAGASRAAGAGWLAWQLPWIASLASCAREDARRAEPFTTLTPAEGAAMRALAAQIIPSEDDAPGAEEAGAVYFVDRALRHPYFVDRGALIRAGLANLDARARTVDERATGFASLGSAEQRQLVRQIARDPFFAAARMLVVVGVLADPSYGGNRDHAGWKLLGIDHQPAYVPPFGWYDAQRAGSRSDHTA